MDEKVETISLLSPRQVWACLYIVHREGREVWGGNFSIRIRYPQKDAYMMYLFVRIVNVGRHWHLNQPNSKKIEAISSMMFEPEISKEEAHVKYGCVYYSV